MKKLFAKKLTFKLPKWKKRATKADQKPDKPEKHHRENNKKLIVKLYSTYAIILLFMLAVGVSGVYSGYQSQEIIEDIYDNRLTSVSEMLTLSSTFESLNGKVASALLLNPALAKEQIPVINELHKEVNQGLELLKAKREIYGISQSDLDTLLLIWTGYETDLTKITDWIDKGNESVGAGTGMSIAASTFNTNLAVKIDVLTKYLVDAVQVNKELAQESYEDAQNIQNQFFLFQIAVSIIAVILTVLIGGIVARSILNPLKQVVHAAQEIARGKLNQVIHVKNRDELGQLAASFNQMSTNISSLIKQVQEASRRVATSSDELSLSTEQTKQAINQIATMIEEVATGAEVQVQSVDESKLAINGMVEGIQRITESSAVMSESSQETAKEAEMGNEALQKAVDQMSTIRTSVGNSATVVKALEERSRDIGEIVNTITDISAQTNLLALNATIEAARAGEHGRGFAVVADEVRKLAEQTGESARQITNLISEIQADTNRAVEAMSKGTYEVEMGMNIINEAGVAFQKILFAVQHVASQTQEVTAVTENLSASSEQVAASVEEMAGIAKESSANTQGVAATTEEQLAYIEEITSAVYALNRMAGELEAVISTFEVE